MPGTFLSSNSRPFKARVPAPLEVDGVHELAELLRRGAAAAPEAVEGGAPAVTRISLHIPCSQRQQIDDDTWPTSSILE